MCIRDRLVWIAAGADPLFVARLFSGLIGVMLVAVTGACGRVLLDERAGWLAALLMACAPFSIQQARFYTVDPLGAVLASGAVLAGMRRRWRVGGVLAGLALACKLSLIWAFVPLVWAIASERPSGDGLLHTLRQYAVNVFRFVLLPASLAFIAVSPWAVLRPVACWRGPLLQALMVAGQFDLPYTRQYAGTWPYAYPLAQMALWGLGPAVTLAGLIGLGVAVLRWRTSSFAAHVAWIWTAFYFLATAGHDVKFPRYLFPLYPMWVVWAVASVRCTRSLTRRLCYGLLMFFTAVPGLAQVAVYTQPHPWAEASRWLYDHVPPGETIVVEMWDHALPVPLPDGDPAHYVQVILPVFDEDGPDKRAQLEAALRDADVIVLASRRGYGALARQPERYAETLVWYRALLAGWDIRVFGRCPHLGLLALSDDPLADADLPLPVSLAERCGTPYVLRLPWLDESFRVYDAPVVIVATP